MHVCVYLSYIEVGGLDRDKRISCFNNATALFAQLAKSRGVTHIHKEMGKLSLRPSFTIYMGLCTAGSRYCDPSVREMLK